MISSFLFCFACWRVPLPFPYRCRYPRSGSLAFPRIAQTNPLVSLFSPNSICKWIYDRLNELGACSLSEARHIFLDGHRACRSRARRYQTVVVVRCAVVVLPVTLIPDGFTRVWAKLSCFFTGGGHRRKAVGSNRRPA